MANDVIQIYINILPLWRHRQFQNLEIFSFQTTKRSSSLESLHNFLVQSAGKLCPLIKMVEITFCGTRIFTQCFIFEP